MLQINTDEETCEFCVQDCFIEKSHWEKIISEIYLMKIIYSDLSEETTHHEW